MIKAVIFDLDGTLLDTLEDIGDTANQVLKESGFPIHPINAYRDFIGHGISNTIRQALPSADRDSGNIERLRRQFEQSYLQNYKNKTKVFAGIPALLDQLHDRDIRLAVLSNKAHEFTQRYTDDLLSRWTFDCVLGHQPSKPKKPDPQNALEIAQSMLLEPEEIAYLGDSEIDMQTAVAANMLAIGVSWGFRSKQTLLEHGAQYIIDQPLQLLELI